MVNEKNKRYFVRDIKEQFESRKKKRFFQKELQELVCYLSDPNDDPTPRLDIPQQILDAAIRQYRDVNRYSGKD